jgi:hypothetical protein
MAKNSRKKEGLSIDFDGVEAGGRAVADGNYDAVLVTITEEESDSGNAYLSCKWKLTSGSAKGATVYDNCSVLPQSLWRLRGMLEAMGIDVPDGVLDLDIDDLVDLECNLEITNEEYEGRDKPRVTAFASLDGETKEDEEEDEEDEEEEEAPVKKTRKSKKPEPEEDEEEDEEDEEEEEAPVKKTRKSKKTGSKKKKGFSEGDSVSFEDEDGDTIKGVIIEINGDEAIIEDSDGSEWDVEVSEISPA